MILITGATGLVGAHLLFKLTEDTDSIAAFYRREEGKVTVYQFFAKNDPQHPNRYNRILWHQGTLNDLTRLEQAFENVTQVVHCAAFVSLFHHHAEKLQKVNVEGTANVVNLALQKGVKKLIHISSIAALGSPVKESRVDETVSWDFNAEHTPYAQSKFGAEMEVWRGIEEGLPAVILNPGVILSTSFWERSSGVIIDRIARGLSFYPTGKLALVSVEDVVQACLIGLKTATLDQNRFILVAQNLSYREFINRIAQGISVPASRYALRKSWLSVALGLEWLFQVVGRKRQLSKGLIDTLCSKLEYDGTKIENTTSSFQYESTSEVLDRIIKTATS